MSSHWYRYHQDGPAAKRARLPLHATTADHEEEEDSNDEEEESVQYAAAAAGRTTVQSSRARLDAAEAKKERATEALQEAKKEFEVARAQFAAASVAASAVAEEECDALLQEDNFWNKQYHKLVQYKEKHGHCLVNRHFHAEINKKDDENRKLGTWVGKQRQLYRKEPKEIEEHRIVALNKIGFDWEPVDTQWQKMYQELVECINSGKAVPHDDSPLGRWVRRQRTEYQSLQDERKSSLTDERLGMLREVKFEWDVYEKDFDAGFNLLVHFRALHGGHCNVPDDYENRALLNWVTMIRKRFKTYQPGVRAPHNPLTDERVNRLNKVGFYWTRSDSIWHKRYRTLVHYQRQYGTCVVNPDHDKSLRSWVNQQRSDYNDYKSGKTSKMSPWRIEELNKLGFDFR